MPGCRVNAAGIVLVPKVAVTVTLWLLAPAVVLAANVAVLAPAATVTEAGTVTEVLLEESETATPAGAANWDSVTVQFELLPEITAAGEH